MELNIKPNFHIAIIMDGNGRWAKKNSLPKALGHKEGAETARKIIFACKELKVTHLTLYAFSSENWQRPKTEVNHILSLLRFYLGAELKSFHEQDIKLKVIGDLSQLDNDIREKINETEELTKNNQSLNLNIAFSYGSRQEILNASKKIADAVLNNKKTLDEIDERYFNQCLYTKDIPDPDLLIRTSGEQRISNFLLWQLAYSELFFTNILWPDFTKENLIEAITEFNKRERRFGGI